MVFRMCFKGNVFTVLLVEASMWKGSALGDILACIPTKRLNLSMVHIIKSLSLLHFTLW